jgi:Fe2+ transport system protein A
MKTLKDVKNGEVVIVLKIHGEGQLRKRIMEMGITKGCEVEVIKVAPLGDPIEITLRGYDLTIRKADAELIEVE